MLSVGDSVCLRPHFLHVLCISQNTPLAKRTGIVSEVITAHSARVEWPDGSWGIYSENVLAMILPLEDALMAAG